jgi:PAS domain S-box-containing protein
MTMKIDEQKVLEAELAEARQRIAELEETEVRLRHAEAELLREKCFVDSALDSLPGIFYLFDQSGRMLRWNRNFQEVSEYSAEEISAMHPAQLFTGDDQAYIAERINRAFTQGDSDAEADFTTRSGRKIPYFFTGHLLVVDGENYLVGMGIDTTVRKENEKELRRSEAKYHSLVDHSNDAIYLLRDGKFEVINSKFEEIFGVTQEDVQRPDFSFLDLVAPKSREMILERGRRIARGEPLAQNYEFTALGRDGREVEVEVSVAHIPYEGGTASQGILRDVTKRKRLEVELLQAQKMEAVGRLAGGVAHDFNNIMTCILGNADLVLSELDPDVDIREYLDEIVTAGNRAAALTRQLLAFSRRQMLQPVVLNLKKLVSDLEKMLRRLIGEDVELVTMLDPGTGCVLADPGQLEQVLMNLAVNARDAMPRGGRLIIETASRKLLQEHVSGKVTIPPGSYALLSVSDSGTGMDEETMANIFEPFFTTKEVGEGTGLGLSMVFGSIKQSDGYILVSSEPGRGTMFTIYLPLVDMEPSRIEGRDSDARPKSGRETVLVVEDDLRVLQLVRAILRQNGYTVLQAESGEDAIRCLDERSEPVDLLITDVVMPKMSGRELADLVLTRQPDLRVIYTSGYTGEAIFRRGFLETDAMFLPKPFTPQALMSKIREVLDRTVS